MIDIDLTPALQHPGEEMEYRFEGEPDFVGVELTRPLIVVAQFCCVDDGVRVKGTVDAELSLQCTRCLADVAWPVKADFSEMFLPDPGDQDVYAYNAETKRVSLDQMVDDILVTQTPYQVLCSETCKGLCPTCGHNLNEGDCGCAAEGPAQDSPFAKLKDLF